MFGDGITQTIVCVESDQERVNIVGQNRPKLLWARSATKHRISRKRSGYVVEQAQMRFVLDDPIRKRRRLIYVGDDQEGTPLEVIVVKRDSGELVVIHAMELRRKFIGMYWEARHGI